MGQAEAQNFKQEGRAGINPDEQTQTNEFGDAKEALHAYESKVGREEEGGLVYFYLHRRRGQIVVRYGQLVNCVRSRSRPLSSC